jgi:putative ABC transport system ATP-binding protein
MSSVEIRDVAKVFKKEAAEIVALQTSLAIDEGQFLCLMGPSGSGKSTRRNLIAGIDRPSAGQVVIGGIDISKMSEGQLAVWRNHTIGFIFQTFNLIPVLTAFENVELPLLLTMLSKAERRGHAEPALSLLGLKDRTTHYPRQLSAVRSSVSRLREQL